MGVCYATVVDSRLRASWRVGERREEGRNHLVCERGRGGGGFIRAGFSTDNGLCAVGRVVLVGDAHVRWDGQVTGPPFLSCMMCVVMVWKLLRDGISFLCAFIDLFHFIVYIWSTLYTFFSSNRCCGVEPQGGYHHTWGNPFPPFRTPGIFICTLSPVHFFTF